MSDVESGRTGRFIAKFKRSGSQQSGSSTPDGGHETVSERRREQIRRAQKSHRQRKAEHMQRLGTQIADLQAKDAAKAARIQVLENTIAVLQSLLDLHGIPYDSTLTDVPDSFATVQVQQYDPTPTGPPQFLQVTMPSSASGVTYTSTNLSSNINLDSNTLNLSDAQLGIDFILYLEQPCLYHHHGPAEDGDGLMAHSSMLQAPIMARAPPLVPTARDKKSPAQLPQASSWTVPSQELERLLYFSSQLRLPEEITPVQAWGLIRERSPPPSMAALNAFREALAVMITCYGFGAVIDKLTFEELMQQYFGQ